MSVFSNSRKWLCWRQLFVVLVEVTKQAHFTLSCLSLRNLHLLQFLSNPFLWLGNIRLHMIRHPDWFFLLTDSWLLRLLSWFGCSLGFLRWNVLFNDALNTFYLRLYGVTPYMVKDHSDSKRGNPQPPHGLLFPISSKGTFICTIPQTG